MGEHWTASSRPKDEYVISWRNESLQALASQYKNSRIEPSPTRQSACRRNFSHTRCDHSEPTSHCNDNIPQIPRCGSQGCTRAVSRNIQFQSPRITAHVTKRLAQGCSFEKGRASGTITGLSSVSGSGERVFGASIWMKTDAPAC